MNMNKLLTIKEIGVILLNIDGRYCFFNDFLSETCTYDVKVELTDLQLQLAGDNIEDNEIKINLNDKKLDAISLKYKNGDKVALLSDVNTIPTLSEIGSVRTMTKRLAFINYVFKEYLNIKKKESIPQLDELDELDRCYECQQIRWIPTDNKGLCMDCEFNWVSSARGDSCMCIDEGENIRHTGLCAWGKK